MTSKKLTTTEKKNILATLIEIYVLSGYEITDLIAKPLSYFDFEKIQNIIQNLKNDNN